MIDQYRSVFGQVERFRPAFYQRFVMETYGDRPEMVMVTHGLAFVVVLLALTSRRFIQTERRQTH